MTDSEIEKIAWKNAPVDLPDDPAFPNHSDLDIWVNGFIAGYKVTPPHKTEGVKLETMYLDIDIDCAHLEDTLHGLESDVISKIRKALKEYHDYAQTLINHK